MTELRLTIPGAPFAQPRPRAVRRGRYAGVYDPKEAKTWKGDAQVHMQQAIRAASLPIPAFSGAVELHIVAVFPCPTSDYRKREPRPRRLYTGSKDWDNVGKAVSDAGNGLLYLDDAQVARGVVELWVGAQGEAPRVEVMVRSLAPAWSSSAETQELLATLTSQIDERLGTLPYERVPPQRRY